MRSLSIAIVFLVITLISASAGLDGNVVAPHQSPEHFPAIYDQWLNQDVVYIISKEERAAFLQLQLEDERKEFIEQFWRRRNPVPESVENFFEEEHYRRIGYANEHFGTKTKLGWQTDRGHVYVVYGKPDSIEAHLAGAPDIRTPEEGRGFVTAYPFEIWKYRYLERVGPDVVLEFVNLTGANDFQFVANDGNRKLLFELAAPSFERLVPDLRPVLIDTLEKAPEVKFKELSELLTAHIVRDQVSLGHSVSFEPVTDCTVLTSVTVTVLSPPSSGASAQPTSRHFEGLIRVQDLSGWVVNVAEAEFPGSRTSGADESRRSITKTFPLFAGSYRVQIALKNVATNEFGIQTLQVEVPSIPLKPH